jgi:ribosomal protein S27E
MTEVSWRWLESTRKLQEEAFGVDFTEREAGPQLADNLVHQGFALIIELAEAFAEVQWKDWAKDRGRHDRDAFIGELVDVGHFLANLLIHFNVTDDEWEALYQAKQDRNRARQAATGGYDARATKCPGCQRELDKPGATAWDSHHMMIVCSGCGKLLGSRLDFHSVVTWLDEVDGSQVWVGAVIVTRCPECGSDLEKPGHAVRDGFSVTCRNPRQAG